MTATVETLTMRQIAELKATAKGKLLADCLRAESGRDTLRLLPVLRRIVAAINDQPRSVTGRKQPRAATTRPERVQIRATEAEVNRWQAVADREGKTLSDWARKLFDEAAGR